MTQLCCPVNLISFLHFFRFFFSCECVLPNNLSLSSQSFLLDNSAVDAFYCIFYFVYLVPGFLFIIIVAAAVVMFLLNFSLCSVIVFLIPFNYFSVFY